MNSAPANAGEWLDSEDGKRAEAAWHSLVRFLESLPFDGAGAILKDLKDNHLRHIEVMKSDLPLCKAIERVAWDFLRSRSAGCPMDAFTLSHTAASLSYLLLLGHAEANSPEHRLSAFEELHRGALNQFLTYCDCQIQPLCRYIKEIGDFVSSLSLGGSRVFLVELPIGNSLIVELLFRALRKSVSVEVIQAALSRNDSNSLGVTRRDLLADKLRGAGLMKNDVVIYFDEWVTGANFFGLCKLLHKILPPTVFLLPIAVLSENASNERRFATFQAQHDRLGKVWGSRALEFRRTLPPFPTKFQLLGQFFWSEMDRMAGYRKMQVHGSFFSSIDSTIRLLKLNRSALEAAVRVHVAEVAQKAGLPQPVDKCEMRLAAAFPEAYQDYFTLRDALKESGVDVSVRSDVNTEAEFEEVLRGYERLVANRPAKLALFLATAYIMRFASSDPCDRYYFREHAPRVVRLQGRMDLMHSEALKFLEARMTGV